MAVKPDAVLLNHTVAGPSYPAGSYKAETVPGALDGSELAVAMGDDVQGILQKLLLVAGITHSGSPDTALASDYFDALTKIFNKRVVISDPGTGTVNAIDLVSIGAVETAYYDGQPVLFKADKTNTGAVTVNLDTIGAANFQLNGIALAGGEIQEGKYILGIYDLGNARFDLIVLEHNQPGFQYGMEMSNAGGDDITLSAGEVQDSTGVQRMKSTANVTKQIDALWADGSGTGGRAAGVALTNDTWYYFFSISKPDGTVNAGFDTSITAANLMAGAAVIAAGYTRYRRRGSVRRLTATNKLFSQHGDLFVWDAPELDVDISGSPIGAGPTNRTLSVPSGINVLAQFNALFSTTVNQECFVHFYSPLSNTQIASASAAPLNTSFNDDAGGNGKGIVRIAGILTNTSSQVTHTHDANLEVLKISTTGYEDKRL